jgi:uncharacterized phage protein (TIGR02216 family)
MQMGLGELRLSPHDFWRATPREIAAAFAAEHVAPLMRAELDGLMQRFPDVT